MLSLLPFIILSGQDVPDFQAELEELICKEREGHDFHFEHRTDRNLHASNTDIYYQEMHWTIDPAVRYISGEITYHFKSRINNLTQLHLDLSNDLQVHSINRSGNTLNYIHSSDQLLTIDLGKSLAIGESDYLTITYEGVPPTNGFGSFEQEEHDGKPILWTLSEPYGVRDWWPAKQDLVDKVDSLDIYITTPLGQLAASNGKLMSITEDNGSLVHHWSHSYPIASYLICLAVTDYASYSHFMPLGNGDTLEILNYVYPEDLAQAQQATTSAIDIISLFNELFGLYPFAEEKYGYAQFEWGGGMEHQTMSFMVNFSFGLQAHETAHQWFGDKVTCGSWTDIWLNEGFATYLTGLTYERFSPDIYWPQWKISTSNSATSQPGGSVYVDDTTSVNRIFSGRLSYNKGSYLLHMLRWVVGDSAFFRGVRDYVQSPGIAYEFARTSDLQFHLEQESGIDLDGFFADWFYGQGHPSYKLEWQQDQSNINFRLSQVTSHPSVSFFEMPVPVHVYTSGGVQVFVLNHTFQDQVFTFETGDVTIDSIKIDPDRWLLSRDNEITPGIVSSVENWQNENFSIHPNPAIDIVQISPSGLITDVILTDLTGQQFKIEYKTDRINVSAVPAGFYILSLLNEKNEVIGIHPLTVIK